MKQKKNGLLTNLAALFVILSLFSVTIKAEDKAPLVFFTHGDTKLAELQPNGTIKGAAYEIFTCAMEHLSQPFTVSIAPLSRANDIAAVHPNSVWYPSSMTNHKNRIARMVGPVHEEATYFFLKKNNPLQSSQPDFKEKARVTAYKGSALEKILLEERYIYVEGSANPQRLIYMLLSDKVDALLTVDMRNVLSPETQALIGKSIRIEPFKKIAAGFQVAKKLHERKPNFTSRFQAAVNSCKAN